jgi:hypothetical protein
MTYQKKSDLIQVLGDLKMGDIYQKNYLPDLLQVLGDLKMTYQKKSKMTHPSLERLENDLRI